MLITPITVIGTYCFKTRVIIMEDAMINALQLVHQPKMSPILRDHLLITGSDRDRVTWFQKTIVAKYIYK
jgi:hypothetical protein